MIHANLLKEKVGYNKGYGPAFEADTVKYACDVICCQMESAAKDGLTEHTVSLFGTEQVYAHRIMCEFRQNGYFVVPYVNTEGGIIKLTINWG